MKSFTLFMGEGTHPKIPANIKRALMASLKNNGFLRGDFTMKDPKTNYDITSDTWNLEA